MGHYLCETCSRSCLQDNIIAVVIDGKENAVSIFMLNWWKALLTQKRTWKFLEVI